MTHAELFTALAHDHEKFASWVQKWAKKKENAMSNCDDPQCRPCTAARMTRANKETVAMAYENVRSQKARGIIALTGATRFKQRVPMFEIMQGDGAIVWRHGDRQLSHVGLRLFARPCPTRPRHGFVDSRAVANITEARAVLAEARNVDPDAELVLMPALQGVYSGILTPTTLTVGAGCDGATAGRGATTFPVTTTVPDSLLAAAGIVESPYIEFVATDVGEAKPFLVQLRDGIKITAAKDYIPREERVTHVEHIHSDMDLVAWEKRAVELAAIPGAVVYHPGGNLSCHFGVHCGINGVAYFTTRAPVLGERIEPTVPEQVWDAKAVTLGLLTAATMPLLNTRALLMASVHALHQLPSLQSTPEGQWALGFGVMTLVRLAALACLGEVRHARKRGGSRSTVYGKAWGFSWTVLRRKLGDAVKCFVDGAWGSGYGGMPWADCTYATLQLLHDVARYVRRPTAARRTAMLGAFNNLVNRAHCNSWLFDKFGSKDMFDRAAQTDACDLISAGTVWRWAMDGADQTRNAVVYRELVRWRTIRAFQQFSPRQILRRCTIQRDDGVMRLSLPLGKRTYKVSFYPSYPSKLPPVPVAQLTPVLHGLAGYTFTPSEGFYYNGTQILSASEVWNDYVVNVRKLAH